MKMIDLYNKTKIKNEKSIVLIKSGIFYETFNADAYIMNYLFDYKIKDLSNYVMVGFPEKIIDIIKDKLNKEKISYAILVDKQKSIFNRNIQRENNYDILLDISTKCININAEINNIKTKLDALKDTKSIDDIIAKIKQVI